MRVLVKVPTYETSEVRKYFAHMIGEAAAGKMCVISRYGRPAAALVSLEDAARLQVLKSRAFKGALKAIDATLG